MENGLLTKVISGYGSVKNSVPIAFSAQRTVFIMAEKVEAKKCSLLAMKSCQEQRSLAIFVSSSDKFRVF